MKSIFEIYLQSVRAGMWGKEQSVWPAEQSDQLLWLNATQGTGPLVFPGVLENVPLTGDLVPVTLQMKGVCVHTMQQQVHLQHTLEVTWRALEKAGISPVLMKGAGLASLYPEPQMRAWGDIDLFVGKEQYHPACAVMRDTFPDALKFDEELDHYKHYNIIADGVSIETHRVTVGLQHPIDERRYAEMEQLGMADTQELTVGGLTVRVPEPTFNALFVFLHSWEHMLTAGANLRQLCDLALLLHHYSGQIDPQRLKRWLKALHLTDVWHLYTCIAVNALGLPRDEAVLYNERVKVRADRLLEDLLSAKMSAPKAAGIAAKNRFARKFHTMQERLRNAGRIKRYSPDYARHMAVTTLMHGALRLFAKDRHWE